MFIPVSYTVKYKNYPYAPKATNSSRMLGTLFTWICLLVFISLWIGLVFVLLSALMGWDSSVPVIVAIISVFPMCFLLFKWKKAREAKIDEDARIETAKVLAMTNEQREQYVAQLRKDGRKRLWIIIGVIIGVVAIFQALSYIKK